MRKNHVGIRAILAVTLLYGVPGQAQDHLVSSAQISARLAQSTAERQANLATVDKLLSSPVASRTISLLGMDTEHVKSRLAQLSDAEARELAARARALDVDPVGTGLNKWWISLIVVVGVLVVVVAVLVIKSAVDCGHSCL